MMHPDAHTGEYDLKHTTRTFFYLCSLFCLGFLLWAALFKLDIVSSTVGEVVPSTKVKRIQHLEGGIVHEIRVHEGDHVSSGQILVVLESTASGASLGELKVRTAALLADIARLEAEKEWLEQNATDSTVTLENLQFDNELQKSHPQLVLQAENLYSAQIQTLKTDIQAQRERILQREKDIEEIEARIRNTRKRLGYIREQIAISEELLKDKLTTRYKHLSFLQEENKLVSKVEEDNTALERSRSALSTERDKLTQIRNEFSENVHDMLQKTRRTLLEYDQRLAKFEDNLERTVIRSPDEGVVKSIYISNEGEVVMPGVTIMDIVPVGDKLVIEAHLPLNDIGYVHEGQQAIIRLTSQDARRYGMLKGRVANIAPDAITTEQGGTYYKVLTLTDRDRFEKEGQVYHLYPGMRVLVGIKTGERTVLEYLLYPYFDAFYQGLRER